MLMKTLSQLNNFITLLRPKHYIKNLFVLAPLFFSGSVLHNDLLIQSLYVFILFSLAASSIYIFNDINDINEDKVHPKKSKRPIASGAVSVTSASGISFALVFISLAGSWLMSTELAYILMAYVILNILYSLGLKHIAILDVSIVSLGFVLRIFAGSVVIASSPSMWIILMTFLLALFLAFAKRRDDVLLLSNHGLITRKNINGYNLEFVNAVMVVMASVTVVAYIFYTTSDSVQARLGFDYLYSTVFFVIIGILRYLQITFVENDSGSPTKKILRDRFLQWTIILWVLAFGIIIYGVRV